VGRPALGKVGTEAAGEGVLGFDGCFVFIDNDGFLVVMEGVGCTAGDADAKVGLLVLGFVIVPIEPFPVDAVGLLPIESFAVDVGEVIDGEGTVPFENRVVGALVDGDFPFGMIGALGMLEVRIVGVLRDGGWAIPRLDPFVFDNLVADDRECTPKL
jgi:hypothetical protein